MSAHAFTSPRAEKCPSCDVVALPGWDQVRHMNAEHPEVVTQRLRDAGLQGADVDPVLAYMGLTYSELEAKAQGLFDFTVWGANVIHQAYHRRPPSCDVAWEQCNEAFCREARAALGG